MSNFEDLKKDYYRLSDLSQRNNLSDEDIFKIIGELDEKYKNIGSHYHSFEGLISNIGSDQKSIAVLNYVLKRLQRKKDLLDPNKFKGGIHLTQVPTTSCGHLSQVNTTY